MNSDSEPIASIQKLKEKFCNVLNKLAEGPDQRPLQPPPPVAPPPVINKTRVKVTAAKEMQERLRLKKKSAIPQKDPANADPG